jgi:YD repeat-containing protein
VSYDEFENVTDSTNSYWFDRAPNLNPTSQTFQTTYVNNRAKKDGVDGRVINQVQQSWTYNAMGQLTTDTRTVQTYDAAGQVTRTQDANNAQIFVTRD